jgi:hypothetical protein
VSRADSLQSAVRKAAVEGVAIKGAINSLAPDLELELAPENKVSTLDDIFLIGLKIGIGWIGIGWIGIGWIGSGRIDGVGWAAP